MSTFIYISFGGKRGGGWREIFSFGYEMAKSWVGREDSLWKSPLRLKPGAWVELRTCVFGGLANDM